MRVLQSSSPAALSVPVQVILRGKEECIGDPDLAGFRCSDGPAAGEVGMIVANLLSGAALEETVAMLKLEDTGELVGLVSIRMDGNAQIRGKASTPWFLRRISVNPYVNLLARDERFHNHLLADGRTRISAALLRAGLEVVAAERGGEPLPSVWALVKRENFAGKRAFAQLAFHRHRRSAENQQDVVVRRAAKPLPTPPGRDAYLPAGRSRMPSVWGPRSVTWALNRVPPCADPPDLASPAA